MAVNQSNKNLPQQEPRSSCAIANGLEILGDRWTMLIIRDLMFTNRNEFGHLLHSGEGISTNILSERLDRLQCWGVIEKLPHPTHGKKFVYELTDKGAGLASVLIEFALWSEESIEGAFIPPSIKEMMLKDRENLLQKINAREPIIYLEL